MGQSHLVEYHTAIKMSLLEVASVNVVIYKKQCSARKTSCRIIKYDTIYKIKKMQKYYF